MNNTVIKSVQEYYGEVLKTKDDLKTSACCPADAMPEYLRPYLKKIHGEIQDRFYGCGSPIPEDLEGKTVLDLGCGTGRDAYVISQLVGEKGKVIGIDMTEEQLVVARKYIGHHMDKFGFKKPNIEFHNGYIEDLKTIGIEDNSIDVVVSNCVLNLSPDKETLFREIFRVLKPGGELYFSDIFADRRIPEELANDPVMLGECLGGAMYIGDFQRLLKKLGCADFRMVSKGSVDLIDPEIKKKSGMIGFCSATIRAFKLELENECENYGHVAYYQGSIAESPHEFVLDNHHVFKTGLPVPVCGNTADMLSKTRYAEHFKVVGDYSTHYGIFDCDSPADTISNTGACC